MASYSPIFISSAFDAPKSINASYFEVIILLWDIKCIQKFEVFYGVIRATAFVLFITFSILFSQRKY